MSTLDPREFATATGERVTITMDDGRSFRAMITDVRATAEFGGLKRVSAEMELLAPKQGGQR